MERVNLLAPEVRANPYPYFAEMRRSAAICQIDPGGIWAVSPAPGLSSVISAQKAL